MTPSDKNATQIKKMRKTEINLEIIKGAALNGKYDLPCIGSGYATPPKTLLPFNQAKSSDDDCAGIHFFIDDYQFERVWRSPMRYTEMLKRFDCILSPDFSLYVDMPMAMKIWNIYRSRAIGAYWQRKGLNVIPTLQWADPQTYHFCFNGIERNGMVAVSTLGAAKSRISKQFWKAGMKEAIRQLHPHTILLYGSQVNYDFNGIKVIHYENNTIERLRSYGR